MDNLKKLILMEMWYSHYCDARESRDQWLKGTWFLIKKYAVPQLHFD